MVAKDRRLSAQGEVDVVFPDSHLERDTSPVRSASSARIFVHVVVELEQGFCHDSELEKIGRTATNCWEMGR
jgi:hypothetical protein